MAEKTALISVFDKTGLEELARRLYDLGWKIYASTGTAGYLGQRGIEVLQTEEITGVTSLLGGRVKTLHPELHAAILAAGEDREARIRDGKVVFDLVAVDFYDFSRTSELPPDDPKVSETIDIGGPAMARAAAKNWQSVLSLTGTDCFPRALDALSSGGDDRSYRRAMAARTFDIVFRYDMAIALKLEEGLFPGLRYGENPHQEGRFHPFRPIQGLAAVDIASDKTLSYNNIMDADAAWDLLLDLPQDRCCVVLLKHGNPCGVGMADDLAAAFDRAFRADTVSPYGGIMAVNREVTQDLVGKLKGLFLELILAPSYGEEALQRLSKRKKLRVLTMPVGSPDPIQLRSVWGGMLVQERDLSAADLKGAETVTERAPTDEERTAMDLAWRVCRSVRSNAVVLADKNGVLGVGAGQMSRIESLDLAVRRAEREGLSLKGAVMASDGFFPFRDGPDLAAEAGITAIVQPGGSIRDEEVVQAADEHGMAMLMTHRRHFRH
jgi:phosphoribosylaminoimidazolecarboxamide formyltransferase/IMP cyclohydrolase